MNYQRMLSGVLAGVSAGTALGKKESSSATAEKSRYPVGQGQSIVTAIPDTVAGIEFQVAKMAEYVRDYSGHPDVVKFARQLVRNAKAQDLTAEAKHIYKFLLAHTRYVRDPSRRELIQTPELMVRDIKETGLTQGDCDELATLTATLLEAIGHNTRFVFGAFERGWQHVWAEDLSAKNGNGLMLDLAERMPVGKVLPFDKYGTYPIWQ